MEQIAVPAGYRAVGGTAFRFRPDRLRFGVPVEVRFDGSARDATVFWSRDASPEVLEPLPTRTDGSGVVASVDHFSIGFAGWDESADLDDAAVEGDAGMGDDAAVEDDAAVDAGTDAAAGPADGGRDAGLPAPGVTCVVQGRTDECTAEPPITYSNVPFAFHSNVAMWGPSGALTSPLMAFQTFANSPEVVFAATDTAGSQYSVGTMANITRTGSVIAVDIDVSRYGSACAAVDPPVPLVSIRCTGTTSLAAPSCPMLDPTTLPALACSVTRRDAACVASTTTVTPSFRAASGVHGADSELRTSSEDLVAVLGGAGEVRFFREASCSSFVTDARSSVTRHRVYRVGDRVAIQRLASASTETCRDGLGVAQPRLNVVCQGVALLESP